jgi:hypothetical protein
MLSEPLHVVPRLVRVFDDRHPVCGRRIANTSSLDCAPCKVTPTIVAGVCYPGVPRTPGLAEAGYNAGPIAAHAEEPEC